MPSPSDRFVVLSSGLAVALEPVLLLLDLEARGLRVSRSGDEMVVSPRGRLSDAERDALIRWRASVLALVDYHVPERVQ